MTITNAYDRLVAAPVSEIHWRDGSEPLRCPTPMVVRAEPTDEHAEAWVVASEDGLCFHFNALGRDGEMRGQMEPVSNIASIL